MFQTLYKTQHQELCLNVHEYFWGTYVQLHACNITTSILPRYRHLMVVGVRRGRKGRTHLFNGCAPCRGRDSTRFNYQLEIHIFQSEFRRLWGSSTKFREWEIIKSSGWIRGFTGHLGTFVMDADKKKNIWETDGKVFYLAGSENVKPKCDSVNF